MSKLTQGNKKKFIGLFLSLCVLGAGLATYNSFQVYSKPSAKHSLKIRHILISGETVVDNGIIKAVIDETGKITRFMIGRTDIAGGKGKFTADYAAYSGYHSLETTSSAITFQNETMADLCFNDSTGVLDVELHYVFMVGLSGFYSYMVVEGREEPASIREIRTVYRLDPEVFDYIYTSDILRGQLVPTEELEKAEEIMDATFQLENGTVYSKYNWANYITQDLMHGFIGNSASSENRRVGSWVITPSKEFINGGPERQELMVHATYKTPLLLSMLQGEHFGASFQNYSAPDRKIFGPFLIYFNEMADNTAIIADAKSRAIAEANDWPYTWLQDPGYSINRSTVDGQIIDMGEISTENATIVLTKYSTDPYVQGKEYIFWDTVDETGHFHIKHVIPGTYTALIYGANRTDDLQIQGIEVEENLVDLGVIEWNTNTSEYVLWQIGKADRRSDGYNLSDEPRQYGIWEKVPVNVDFQIGESSEDTDWYYAQTKDGTWNISFNIDQPLNSYSQTKIVLGVAGASGYPYLNISLNGNPVDGFRFQYRDSAVTRGALTSGKYQKFEYYLPISYLSEGNNSLTFQLYGGEFYPELEELGRGAHTVAFGVMYDCVKCVLI